MRESCQSQSTMRAVCVFLLLLGSALCTRMGPTHTCDGDLDCEEAAECLSNRCVCRAGYALDISSTTCLGGVGKNCELDTECVEGAYCKERRLCNCQEHLIQSPDGTRCDRDVSASPTMMIVPCLENPVCVQKLGTGALCNKTSSLCECDWRFQHYLDAKCWYVKGLGKDCTDTNECFIKNHVQRVWCNTYNNTCTCKDNFVPNADGTDCDAGLSMQATSLAVLLGMFLFTRFICA